MRFKRAITFLFVTALGLTRLAHAASYEITVHPTGPVGGDARLVCAAGDPCRGSIDMPELPAIDVEVSIEDYGIGVFFSQSGYALPVQIAPAAKKTYAFLAPVRAFRDANPVVRNIVVYAPEGYKEPIYPYPDIHPDQGRNVIINPVITKPGWKPYPVRVEVRLRRLD